MAIIDPTKPTTVKDQNIVAPTTTSSSPVASTTPITSTPEVYDPSKLAFNAPKQSDFADANAYNQANNEFLSTGSYKAPTTQQISNISQTTPQVNADGSTPSTDAQKGMAGKTLVNNLSQIATQGVKATEGVYDEYTKGAADFEAKKQYYSNSDQLIATNKAIQDARKTLAQGKVDPSITEQESAIIANRLGVSTQEVIDPNSVFNKGQMTPEGKQKFGVTAGENAMADMTTNYQRQQADILTNLKNTQTNIHNQIDDVAKQSQRNVDFLTAQGAWSGGGASSAYTQGIQNVKDDAATTISRLVDLANNMASASSENLQRATDDYNKAYSRAKTDMDMQIADFSKQYLANLAIESKKYSPGSTEMLSAIKNVANIVGTKSIEAQTLYMNTCKQIEKEMNDNLDRQQKLEDNIRKKSKENVDRFYANGGDLLKSTTFQDIDAQTKSGDLSQQDAQQIKSGISSNIYNEMLKNAGEKGKIVAKGDQEKIASLLGQGYTAQQVFTQIANANPIYAPEMKDRYKTVGAKSSIYDAQTGKFVTGGSGGGTGTSTGSPVVSGIGGSMNGVPNSYAPSAAEEALFLKGAQYINKKGGLSSDRYNQIAAYRQANPKAVNTNVAKEIADYTMTPNTLATVYKKDPDTWNQIMQQVVALNPEWSDSNYDMNHKNIVAYSAQGYIGKSLKSLNTVMGHLSNYLDAINEKNLSFTPSVVNKGLNYVGSLGYGTALSKLDPISTNIGDETAKFFAGGQSSAGDREQRKGEVNTGATPGQAKEFVRTQLDQLGSQTRTWNEQYKQATGHYKEGILTPNAKEEIMKMNKKYNLGVSISEITGNPADDDETGNNQPSTQTQAPMSTTTSSGKTYNLKISQ